MRRRTDIMLAIMRELVRAGDRDSGWQEDAVAKVDAAMALAIEAEANGPPKTIGWQSGSKRRLRTKPLLD